MPASAMRRIAMPDEGIETLFGPFDENLRHLESALNVTLKTSGHDLVIEGATEDLARAERAFEQLAALLRSGYRFGRGDVQTAAQLVAADPSVELQEYFQRGGARAVGRRHVTPKSVTQRRYLDAIDQYDIVFGVGPSCVTGAEIIQSGCNIILHQSIANLCHIFYINKIPKLFAVFEFWLVRLE
jgi:phosphate starvation-inducible PhoH-like protein